MFLFSDYPPLIRLCDHRSMAFVQHILLLSPIHPSSCFLARISLFGNSSAVYQCHLSCGLSTEPQCGSIYLSQYCWHHLRHLSSYLITKSDWLETVILQLELGPTHTVWYGIAYGKFVYRVLKFNNSHGLIQRFSLSGENKLVAGMMVLHWTRQHFVRGCWRMSSLVFIFYKHIISNIRNRKQKSATDSEVDNTGVQPSGSHNRR